MRYSDRFELEILLEMLELVVVRLEIATPAWIDKEG